MSALDRLSSAHQRRGYVLQVAGLRYRYATHAGIADGAAGLPASLTGGEAGPYTTLPLIAELGSYRASVDIAGGVADYDPINIRLGTAGDRAVDGDPGIIFGRLLPRSLSPVAQIAATLSQTGTTATLNTTAAITAGDIIHVGAEAMHVVSVDDGTTLTVARGVGGTAPRVHAVDSVSATVPEVYDEPATWPARRAVLYACGLAEDGRRCTPFVEVYRGILDGTPTVDGDSVLLVLAPLASLLDVGLGPPVSETLLLQGFHFYTARLGTTFLLGSEMPSQRVRVSATRAGPPVEWDIPPDDATALERTFDIELVNGDLLADTAHPRGLWFPEGSAIQPTVLAPDDWIGAAPPTGLSGGTLTHSVSPRGGASTGLRREGRAVTVGAGLQEWPEVLRAAIADKAAPGTTAGLDGFPYDLRLDTDGAAPAFVLTLNADVAFPTSGELFPGGGLIVDETAGLPDWSTGEPLAMPGWPESLWYPILIEDPDGINSMGAIDRNSGQVGRAAQSGARRGVIRATVGSEPARVPLVGIARAYYQTGEHDILVESDLGISASNLRIRIDYTDPRTGEAQVAECVVTGSTPVVVDGDTIGHRLTLSAEYQSPFAVPSFGDWPGLDRARIRPVLSFEGEDIGTIVATVLRSAGGGAPATYDSAAYGVGLLAEEVDIPSMLAIVPPPGAAEWSLRAEPGATARELIEPLLRAAGYALTMRVDGEGRCRLTAVALGYESATDAVGVLDPGNLGARVSWGTDDRIANQFVYNVNWDPIAGESQRSVTVNDMGSQARYGDVAKLEFDLRGLRILDGGADGSVVLRAMYLRHRALLADPRRTWRVAVGSGPGLFADLGSVYLVTHPLLRGYDDRLGVTSEAARVIEIEVGLQGEPTSLTLQTYGATGRGWNASAVLTGAPAGLVLTVAANAYSPVVNIGSRDLQTDAQTFAPGDEVLIAAPWAADDAGAPAEVTAVTSTTITVDAVPVGATTGWVVWPAAYGVASARHRSYAYHADTDGTVGDDPGAEIV